MRETVGGRGVTVNFWGREKRHHCWGNFGLGGKGRDFDFRISKREKEPATRKGRRRHQGKFELALRIATEKSD